MTDPTPSQPSPDVAGIVAELETVCRDGEMGRGTTWFISKVAPLAGRAAQALTALSADNKVLREERDEAKHRLAMMEGEWRWAIPPLQMADALLLHAEKDLDEDDDAGARENIQAARDTLCGVQAAESSAAKWKAEAERMGEALKPFVARFIDRTELPETTILSVRRFNTDARHAYEQPMFTVGDLRRARAALPPQEGK